MISNALEVKPEMDVLKSWLDLLGSSPEQLRGKFAHTRFRYDPDSTYGSLTDVALLSGKEGLFYFERGELILVHIHSKPFLAKLDGHSLLSELGTPAAHLRSRAGKGHSQYVYPARGIAFSSDSEGRVDFIEVFRSISLDAYLDRIYIDPGAFVK